MHLDFGFQPDRVATAAVNLPAATYKDSPALIAFEQRSLAAIRALPDVEAAAATTLIPFSGNINNNVIMAEGHVMKPGESLLAPTTATVTAGYFETMGVKLAAGRFFDARDADKQPNSVVIDDRLARAFWPGQDAVGRRLYRPSDPAYIREAIFVHGFDIGKRPRRPEHQHFQRGLSLIEPVAQFKSEGKINHGQTLAFPVNIHANEAIHEIQFGHLTRPNHTNRQFDADGTIRQSFKIQVIDGGVDVVLLYRRNA
jgi:hypothetical protein